MTNKYRSYKISVIPRRSYDSESQPILMLHIIKALRTEKYTKNRFEGIATAELNDWIALIFASPWGI